MRIAAAANCFVASPARCVENTNMSRGHQPSRPPIALFRVGKQRLAAVTAGLTVATSPIQPSSPALRATCPKKTLFELSHALQTDHC